MRMCLRLDQLTTRGTKSMYCTCLHQPMTSFTNTTVWLPWQRDSLPQRCHALRQAHEGTICELARDYRESRTTHNTALTMTRALAGSRACSSRLSTLLFATACCGPTVYYSFVLQRCSCCREKQSSNINPSPASPKALASSSLHLKFET